MTGGRPGRAAALAAIVVLAACGGADDARTTPAAGGAAGPRLSGTATVFAAASLTETFGQLARDFEAEHPGSTITTSFGASSSLAQQVNQGAPADVFAAASEATMQQVVDAKGVAGRPTVFVTNVLQVAVPKGNPGRVSGIADLGRPELRIALCAEQVPCGAAAKKALAAARVTAAPDTLEQDVKAALTKVSLGEVDAALVYRTDVRAAGDTVTGIDFAESAQAVNSYPIAVLAAAPNPDLAAAFVDYVLGEHGRALLTAAGFTAP